MNATSRDEHRRRWRLLLGAAGDPDAPSDLLDAEARGMDQVLEALYESDRKAGLGSSSPNVARWLGDIRKYFPSQVVQVMQKDALERLDLRQMLFEPELLATVQPSVHLVAQLLALKELLPAKTRQTAREVVAKVVEELRRRLEEPMRNSVLGALNRSVRNRRPRLAEIDWNRTIRANLRNYIPELRTVVPEVRIGSGRRRNSLRDLVLCVDQSGSMATSVVYSGIFSAVLASLPSVSTRMVVFDTAVVDLSHLLQDPVDVLFGTQLGGGTDINAALAYTQGIVRRPEETVLVLVSDLYEGGNAREMLARAAKLVQSGVQMVCLLALNDEGAPCHDHAHAEAFASMGVPVFACTPDLFPDLMAAAIRRENVAEWAGRNRLNAVRAGANGPTGT